MLFFMGELDGQASERPAEVKQVFYERRIKLVPFWQ